MRLITPAYPLREREIECLQQAAEGLPDKEIGQRLGIGHKTVSTYLGEAYSKLGARNRAHAVWLAVSTGQIREAVE